MAAITAAISAGAAVAGTAMSFSEASKQRKAATTARIEADKAIQEARKRAEENVYKALSLSKEPYDRAREAALVQGAQAIEAGVESERGAAATAGRIQMAQNELQRDISGEQTQQIQALNMTVAEEDARLKDYAAKISMAEAEGAQLAMRDAEERRAAAVVQGVQGIANTASAVGAAIPLYQKSQGAKAYDQLIKQGLAAGKTQEQIQNIVAAQGGPLAGMGYSKTSIDANGKPIVGFQTPMQFQDSLSQDPKTVKELLKLNLFAPDMKGPEDVGSLFDINTPPRQNPMAPTQLNPFDIYG